MKRLTLMTLAAMLLAAPAAMAQTHPDFNGHIEYSTTTFGLYYWISGSQFPNGQTVNGDNGSGGVFRFVTDDPNAGYATQQWVRDDWFAENSGIALTMKNEGATVFDNNLIENGDPYGPDDYYNNELNQSANPIAGLYMGYGMSNNEDWIYSGYFKLTEATTVDTLIGYFDGTGYYGNFDPDDPRITYRMNIFSSVAGAGGDAGYLMPTDTGSFQGDVLTSDTTAGTFSWSDTGVARRYSGWDPGKEDPIWRLVWELDEAVTLDPGEYFFSHDVAVPEPATLSLLALGGLALVRRKRR